MLQHCNRSNIFKPQRPQCFLRTSPLNKMKVIGFSINSQICQWPQTVTSPSAIKKQLQPMPSTSQLPNVGISIFQLNTTTPNQKVNVTGTLSFGQKQPKKVLVKSTQEIFFVKEDCILENSTGHTSIHISDGH